MRKVHSTDGIELNEMRDGAEKVATIAAAAQVGIFASLLDGPLRSETIANRAGLDLRATQIVLDALVDLAIVTRTDAGYGLTRLGRRYLADPSSPDYAAGGLPLWLQNIRAWTHLPDSLRSGRPWERRQRRSREELRHYLDGMAAAPAARIRRLVQHCLERQPTAATVLDLGAGPGHVGGAFAAEGLEATLFDLPEVVDVAADEYGLRHRTDLHLVAGDFMEDALPPGPFDIVLASNITHIYSPAQNTKLLEKIHRVLQPLGLVAVADFVRGMSPRAARFAIVMLLRTEGGNTYTAGEYRAWLGTAGFRDVVIEDIDVDRQVISAHTP